MRATGPLFVGLGLAVVGLLGYAAGVVAAYPGRELSIVAVMVGLTLVPVGLWIPTDGDPVGDAAGFADGGSAGSRRTAEVGGSDR